MAFNNKQWMRLAVPDGSLIGSTTAAIPIQPGYYIGVSLGRYSQKDMRRVRVFCGVGLDTEKFTALRFNNEFIDSLPIDQLESMIPVVHEAVAEYRKKYRDLDRFAAENLSYMKEWRSINALLDIVIAHYLDPMTPLVDFPLTEEEIHRQVRVELPYQFEHVQTILTLQQEWSSPDYADLREARIQNWLAKNRLKPDFFGER